MESTYQAALQARTDLQKYSDNALLLFTLQLRFEIDDIDAVATNSLTDGADDKKCDLIYIDKESQIAVIAQGYFCRKSKPVKEAPANKASDLNTAVAWLFSRPIDQLPKALRSAASELRTALSNNEVNSVEFWYSHNLPESENVQNELDTVARSAKSSITQAFVDCKNISVYGVELGISATEELYKSLTTPILIPDELNILTSDGFCISDSDWQTFVTTVPAQWLYDIFQKYKLKLFSANIRGYLGSRNSDANINNGIKQTAQSDPENFCIFNNGITAITHKFHYEPENHKLQLYGISIVNGAQTTGAIGNLPSPPSSNVKVQARFIVCPNIKTIKSIIRYNNSQNKVEAPDFRSNDLIQTRLVNEFSQIPNAEYLGGRRGGAEDVIKRRANLLASSTVGQSLTAFHGDPLSAYNRKSDIWKSNSLYDRIFNSKITARHIVFVYSLYEALDEVKRQLSSKLKQGSDYITEIEKEQLSFFEHRGSTVIATTAIASCLEVITQQSIPNKFSLSFGKVSPDEAIKNGNIFLILSLH